MTTEDIASELAGDEYANFSYQGGLALAEWLEELDAGMGEESEFDRVGIRCDFSQYECLLEWAEDYFVDYKYDLDLEPEMEEFEVDDRIRDYIADHGVLIEFDGGIIVNSF